MYCTVAEIKSRLPKLLKDIPDDDEISSYITDTMAKIDAVLCKKYNVPFVTVPALVNSLTKDFVISNIITDHYAGDGTVEELPYVKDKLRDAKDLLSRLQSGKDVIPGTIQKASLFMTGYVADGQAPVVSRFDLYNEPETLEEEE